MTRARDHRPAAMALLALLCAGPAHADWINLTGAENAPNIAEIYIADDRVRIVLEIYIGDIDAFRPLTPEGFTALRLSDGTGDPLELVAIPVLERRLRQDRYSPFRELGAAIPWATVTQPPDDPRVWYAELEFALPERPDTLVITPALGPNGLARQNIGMVVFHQDVPVTDFRFLGGREVLHLDWSDPWYSRFANPNLGRHHQAALTSYLYVEPYTVRHEILIRPMDLAGWLDLQLANPERIQPAEFAPLLERIGRFLLDRNRITVDGDAVRPILDQAEFVTIGMYGIQGFTPTETMALNTAVVGVMLSYPTPGMPRQVRMQWDLFNDRIREVPATAVDPAGPFPSYLSPGDDTLVWNNYLRQYRLPAVERVPVRAAGADRTPALVAALVTALLAWLAVRARGTRWIRPASAALLASAAVSAVLSGGTLSRASAVRPLGPDEAAFVLEALLKNVYHAFYLRNDEDVYDKLALTVDGDLLEQVFLQQRRSFAVQSAGGAEGKVRAVRLLESRYRGDVAGADSLAYAARWTATGAVSHWGHTHDRTNLYEATVTISPSGELWKITGLDIRTEERLAQSVDDLPLGEPGPAGAAAR